MIQERIKAQTAIGNKKEHGYDACNRIYITQHNKDKRHDINHYGRIARLVCTALTFSKKAIQSLEREHFIIAYRLQSTGSNEHAA